MIPRRFPRPSSPTVARSQTGPPGAVASSVPTAERAATRHRVVAHARAHEPSALLSHVVRQIRGEHRVEVRGEDDRAAVAVARARPDVARWRRGAPRDHPSARHHAATSAARAASRTGRGRDHRELDSVRASTSVASDRSVTARSPPPRPRARRRRRRSAQRRSRPRACPRRARAPGTGTASGSPSIRTGAPTTPVRRPRRGAELLHGPERRGLRAGEDLSDVAHLGGRHALGLQQREPRARSVRVASTRSSAAVSSSRCRTRAALSTNRGSSGSASSAQHLAASDPQVLRAGARQHDPPVGRAEASVRRERRRVRPEQPGHLARDEVARRQRAEPRERELEQ